MSNEKSITAYLTTLLSSLGEKAKSCKDVRHCSRCNLPLTDFSSWERGFGPICAKKDTHLFAKTIPANFSMATAHAMSVKTNNLPKDIISVWTDLLEIILDKSERANLNSGEMVFNIAGEDCRLIVRVIDWMNSFVINQVDKNHLIQIVKYLGYPGLSGVLSGISSTGEAELKFEAGKLSLVGSSNKAGFNAMRVIPGIVIPRYRGQGAYTAPAEQYRPFIAATMEFWPCFNGEIDAIMAQSEEWLLAHPVMKHEVPVKPAVMRGDKPLATITNRVSDFMVSFEWDKSISFNLVASIKEIPAKDRKYDPASKSWSIKNQYKDRVIGLFNQGYQVEQVNSF